MTAKETYEAMLELAESNESMNCWNNETWCKIAAWLRENKRPIDAPTARKLAKDYDDYEDIKCQLELKWPTKTPILTKGYLIKPE